MHIWLKFNYVDCNLFAYYVMLCDIHIYINVIMYFGRILQSVL